MTALKAALMIATLGVSGMALADVADGSPTTTKDMTSITAKSDMTTAPIVSADDGCSMARHQAVPLGFLGFGVATAFMLGRRKKSA